jgi:hypothetical protein
MIINFLKWMLGIFEPATREPAIHKPAPPAPAAAQMQAVVAAAEVDHRAGGTVLVPGKELTLGGKAYVIAPLNAAAVKLYREQIKAVFVGGLPDIELVAKLALSSLRRNYPAMTEAMVEEIIDYQNYFEVWEVLLNISGLVAQAKEMVRRVQSEMEGTGLTP